MEPDPGPRPAMGLRERKKVRTRSAIQHHALRLFREQGYQQTTVSQIAEAAEVSESTFFRYFPSKEAVVLTDDFDEVLVETFRRQPPELTAVQAMRAAIREVFSDITDTERADAVERAELFFREPELREALAADLVDTVGRLAELLAARAGRAPGDVAVRAVAGAVVGAMMAVVVPELGSRLPDDFLERMDQALAQLEAGFTI